MSINENTNNTASASKPLSKFSKGDTVVRKGELCTVLSVDFSLDPIAYTVKVQGSERIIGTEESYLSHPDEVNVKEMRDTEQKVEESEDFSSSSSEENEFEEEEQSWNSEDKEKDFEEEEEESWVYVDRAPECVEEEVEEDSEQEEVERAQERRLPTQHRPHLRREQYRQPRRMPEAFFLPRRERQQVPRSRPEMQHPRYSREEMQHRPRNMREAMQRRPRHRREEMPRSRRYRQDPRHNLFFQPDIFRNPFFSRSTPGFVF